MFVESLKKLGFSEKEAQVYLTLLKVGPSPASTLASRVGMKRVTAYNVLDSLKEKGLVSFRSSGRCRRYIPHDPEHLLRRLESQKAALKAKLEIAEKCVEGLHANRAKDILPKNKKAIFKGRENIIKVLHERVDEKSALFVIFTSFGESRPVANCLRDFLKVFRIKSHKLFLAVPKGECSQVGRDVGRITCSSIPADAPLDSNMLIQSGQAFFLSEAEGEIELIHIENNKYASFLNKVLLKPYFH